MTSSLACPGLFDPTRSGQQLDDYDYPLPEGLIARYPLARRDASRMLVLDRQSGHLEHRQFADLCHWLSPGDVMVLNNTQVLPARFLGHRDGHTGRVEVLLLHPDAGDATVWQALMRPTRKLKPGTRVLLPPTQAYLEVLEVGERGRGLIRVHPVGFDSIPALMQAVGHMPIPPYLGRAAEDSDRERYQTVFSKVPGAQAAPTAGLHFTPDVLAQLRAHGVQQAELTLAVSAGTFRTVEAARIDAHRMDPEAYAVPAETAEVVNQTRRQGGRVLAVGTTVAKTLETVAARHGGRLQAESDWSELFIYPGFQFQAVDMLLTNFHLPKSTLLMLISAFAGRDRVAQAYQQALAQSYRFFSYGDCMLIV